MTLPRGIVDVERGIFEFATIKPKIWRQKTKVLACLKLRFGLY
jgi:hypothetical protein